MIVVDANVWVHALAGSDHRGEQARRVMTAEADLVVPAHAAAEVVRTLARLEKAGTLTAHQAGVLADAVARTDLRVVGFEPWLLADMWSLRHDVSTYDAPYLALARRFGLPLVTADARLARAAEQLGVEVRPLG